jgi:hypothetical protein
MTDTAQNLLIWLIIVLVIGGSLTYHELKDPDSHLAKELQSLVRHYRFGLVEILQNRWIIVVPVLLYSVQFLFDMPRRMRIVGSMKPWMHESLARQGLIVNFGTHFGYSFWHSRLQDLAWAPTHLNAVYYGLIYGLANANAVLLLIFLIAGVVLPVLLKIFPADFDMPEACVTSFIGRVFQINLAMFIVSWTVLWTHHLRGWNSWAQGFISLSVVSFLEAWFLSSAWMTLRRNAVLASAALDVALIQFKSLYLFNMAWVTIFVLMQESEHIAAFLLRHSTIYAHSGILDRFNIFLIPGYMAPWFVFLTVFIPFFLVAEDINPRQAWRRNVSFMQREWLGYFLFALSGMVLWFIPVFLRKTASHMLNPLSFIQNDVELLLGTLEILFVVWYFISVYDWFWERYALSAGWTTGLLAPLLSAQLPEPVLSRDNLISAETVLPSSAEGRPTSPSICPHCGAPSEPDSNFCDQCGRNLV